MPTACPHSRASGTAFRSFKLLPCGMLRVSPWLCLEAKEETAETPPQVKPYNTRLCTWLSEVGPGESVFRANWKFLSRDPCDHQAHLCPCQKGRGQEEPLQAGEAGTYRPGRLAHVLLVEAIMLRANPDWPWIPKSFGSLNNNKPIRTFC